MTTSPFKFLDSYTREDIGSFFGRERETDELFRLCFTGPILVVYGGSGTGKTSLVQCGLQSKFNESDWLPILVRRSGDLLASLRVAIASNTLTPTQSTNLGEQVANLYLDHFKPIYFLFDQFEELFIFGTHAEATDFFSAIGRLLEKERNARAVFIVREEYLAELTRYERIIPGLIENRYRVERLSHHHAMNVVEKLCGAHGITCAEGFSAALVERLDPESHGIELSYLQVFLDRCWRTRQDDEPFSPALLERIGHVDDLLGAFLDEQVADTPDPQRAEALLKTFVSDQGTKRQLTSAEAHEWVNTIGTAMELADVERLLQVFVTKRLLKERDERGRYELLHDALARQIFQRITRAEQELIEVRQFVQQAHGQFLKRGVKLTANDLSYLRPYRNQLHLKGEVKEFVEGAFGEEERRERQRKRRRTLVLGAIALALVITAAFAIRLYQDLRRERAINDSKVLAAKAMDQLVTDPPSAYLLAERAFNIHPGIDAERALVTTYPFLYPEVARFKGNGLSYLPFSKRFAVFDLNKETVSCFGTDGSQRWQRTVPGLSYTYNVLDTTGRLFIHGDTSLLMNIDGTVLLTVAEKISRSMSSRDGRRLLILSSTQLAMVGSSGSVDLTRLDTVTAHRALVDAPKIDSDDSLHYLLALKADTVHFFDLTLPGLPLIAQWHASEPLDGDLVLEGRSESVLTTSSSLVHLDWSAAPDIRVIKHLDLARIGISPKRDLMYQGQPGTLFFKGSPNRLYVASTRSIVPLPGMRSGDRFLWYDATLQRSACYRPQGDGAYKKMGLVVIFSQNGDSLTSYNTITQTYPDKKEGLPILSRVAGSERLRYTRFSLSGQELSTTDLQPISTELPNGLSSDTENGKALSYSEKVSVGLTSSLFTSIDTNGTVRRLLTPGSGSAAYPFRGNSAQMLVQYSDSMTALVEAPAYSGPDLLAASPACFQDSILYSSPVLNDTLHFSLWTATGALLRSSMPLHGCMDSLRSPNITYNNTATPLTRRWAKITEVEPKSQRRRGYLIDLLNKSVVDSGSFAQPADYHLLPAQMGLVRVKPGLIEFFDERLRRKKTIPLPVRSYNNLLFTGTHMISTARLTAGWVDHVDLRSGMLDSIHVEPDLIGADLLSRISRNSSTPSAWIDDAGTLFIALGGFFDQQLLVAVEATGRTARLQLGKGIVYFKEGDHGLPRILFRRSVFFSLNGAITMSTSSKAVNYQYDPTAHGFIPMITDEPDEKPTWDKGITSDRAIWRGGEVFLPVQFAGEMPVCNNHLYSRHRAVDRYERFPLFGKDVIKEVREEKKFGEFWTHINAEPLINKVLGTDAYNTGYQIGSLLRDPWAWLGLLLAIGTGVYAWRYMYGTARGRSKSVT
ncbi:MAG TPA: ATP-binding protein [Flavobacteriales bacterium]|nr:ATP-binding protein [Flavobacteriales bacterium]